MVDLSDEARSELESSDSSSSSRDVSSSVAEAFSTEEASGASATSETGEVDATEADKENPFSDIAENTVTMSPDAWDPDKPVAEGNVARNDHLEGMLRNQGFEVKELYTPDANGQTLIDRVAEANELENANLISPEMELTLPTRHEVEAETGGAIAEATAESVQNTSDTVSAEADASVSTELAENTTVAAEAEATAINTGEGAAAAVAEAEVEVEEAVNSEISARAEAIADAAQGPEVAEATASVDAGKVEGSSVESIAEAASDQAVAQATTEIEEAISTEVETRAEAKGEEAEAEATTEIGSATDTSISNTAVAEGDVSLAESAVDVEELVDSAIESQVGAAGEYAEANNEVNVEDASGSAIAAETIAVGNDAEANTDIDVDTATDTTIASETHVAGDDAEAAAEVNIDEISGGTVLSEVTAAGENVTGENEVNVGTADDSVLAASTEVEGTNTEAVTELNVAEATEDTTVIGEAVAEGQGATAEVEANLNPMAMPGQDSGTGQVTAAATDDATGVLTGAEQGQVAVYSQDGEATGVIDADEGTLEAVGEEVNAEVQGMDNNTVVDLTSEGTVTLQDRGMLDELGSLSPMYSGNTISGTAEGQNLDLRANASEEVAVEFTGLEGDNTVEASLPGNGAATVAADLGNGEDAVYATRRSDEQTLAISKTEGSLYVDTRAADYTNQDSTATFIDAGEATVNGTLRGGNGVSNDLTVLRGGEVGDLRVESGFGDDTVVVRLEEGQVAPNIVTREASNGLFGWGSRDAEGILNEGYQPGDSAIYTDGVESVVVVDHNGEVVNTWGAEVDMDALFAQR